MRFLLRLLTSKLFLILIITQIEQIFTKPTVDQNSETIHFEKPKSILYGISSTIQDIEWLLNQLIGILSEMVTGLETDPSLLSNYHFRQILVHMIRRIDHILGHFETVKDLPHELQKDLQRLDCVRIRLSNYINRNNGDIINDSVCQMNGKLTTPKPTESNASNNQMLHIISQIIYIIVQIVNQMGSVGKTGNGVTDTNWPMKSTTPNWENMWSEVMANMMTTVNPNKTPIETSTMKWDELISQIMGQMSSTIGTEQTSATRSPIMTSTPDWDDLFSQIMGQIQSSTGRPPMIGSTSEPIQISTTDWGELISAVIGQIENQFGTTANPPIPVISISPSRSTQTITTTTQTNESTTFDIQICIDSILGIVREINSQMPSTTTTSTISPQSTEDMSALISGILGQIG